MGVDTTKEHLAPSPPVKSTQVKSGAASKACSTFTGEGVISGLLLWARSGLCGASEGGELHSSSWGWVRTCARALLTGPELFDTDFELGLCSMHYVKSAGLVPFLSAVGQVGTSPRPCLSSTPNLCGMFKTLRASHGRSVWLLLICRHGGFETNKQTLTLQNSDILLVGKKIQQLKSRIFSYVIETGVLLDVKCNQSSLFSVLAGKHEATGQIAHRVGFSFGGPLTNGLTSKSKHYHDAFPIKPNSLDFHCSKSHKGKPETEHGSHDAGSTGSNNGFNTALLHLSISKPDADLGPAIAILSASTRGPDHVLHYLCSQHRSRPWDSRPGPSCRLQP